MKRKRKDLEAIFKISQAIISDLYLEDILKLIVEVVSQLMGSRICSLMLLDDDGYLRIKATQSVSKEYNEKPSLKVGEGIAGSVVKHKKPLAIFDVRKHQEYKYKDIAKKEGLVSLLCVPLIVKDRAIGVLNCYTSQPHRFSSREKKILSTIANQAALVIENTRLIIETRLIQEKLEARKLIERAKGILMKELKLDEESAYRLMQKYSMSKRLSLKEIAQSIITTQELRNIPQNLEQF